MRILHVIPSLLIGGAEKLIIDIVPIMVKHGNTVDVLIFNGSNSVFKDKLLSEGINIIQLTENGSMYNPIYIFKLVKYFKLYDIVHAHNFSAQYFVALAKFLTFSRVKIITTEHNTNNKRRSMKAIKLLERLIYRQYCSIICISEKTKVNLVNYLSSNRGVIMINNGVNLNAFKMPRTQSKYELLNTPSDIKLITQVAGFRQSKDQDTVIKSLVNLPDNYHAVFVGDGERRTICEKLVSDLKLSDRVHFLGVRSDVPSILMCSDIVVMSSYWDGFGLAAVEGMAARKPVIATKVDGLEQVVGDAGLLFNVGDANELSRLILELMNDEVYNNKVANSCYEKSQVYDINIMVESYEKVYSDTFLIK